MREFYEKHRDEGEIHLSRSVGHLFAPHFHLNPEILIVRKGGYDITLSGKRYRVGEGCIAVMDSYEIHSYDERIDTSEPDDAVVIIPYRYLARFYSRHEGMRISNPVLCDGELCRSLLAITDEYLTASEPVREAAAELFFAKLEEKLEFSVDKRGGEAALIRRILAYVQERHTGNISRASIAKALGYTEAHISRVFHSYIGKGLSEYINGVRLAYVDRKLSAGDKRSITELIYEAGFGSQQTYYRARGRERGAD